LQVVNFFSPLHGGGSIEVAYQMSKALAQRGHEVVLYTSDFELDQNYNDSLQGVKVYPFHSYLSLGSRPLLMPEMVKRAREELKNFDIIHTHGYRNFPNVVLHHYAQKYGVPYVLQAHGSLTTFFQKGWLKRTFDVIWGYRILKDASRAIAVTRTEAEQYKSMGVRN